MSDFHFVNEHQSKNGTKYTVSRPSVSGTLEELHIGEILMIGDSLKSDIKGAEKMGWKSIQINRKRTSNNLSIRDLTQLNKLIITSI